MGAKNWTQHSRCSLIKCKQGRRITSLDLCWFSGSWSTCLARIPGPSLQVCFPASWSLVHTSLCNYSSPALCLVTMTKSFCHRMLSGWSEMMSPLYICADYSQLLSCLSCIWKWLRVISLLQESSGQNTMMWMCPNSALWTSRSGLSVRQREQLCYKNRKKCIQLGQAAPQNRSQVKGFLHAWRKRLSAWTFFWGGGGLCFPLISNCSQIIQH